jgi:hypothetical protein
MTEASALQLWVLPSQPKERNHNKYHCAKVRKFVKSGVTLNGLLSGVWLKVKQISN